MAFQLWMIKIVAVLTILAGLFLWHKYEVHHAVEQNTIALVAQHEDKLKELTIKSLKVESELKTQVDAVKGEKDAQIKTIDRKYRAALNSLRQRTETTGSTTTYITRDTCNSEGTERIDAEGLLGRHAEISLGIARDAEELKAHLNACYMQYDTVREQLEKYRNGESQ